MRYLAWLTLLALPAAPGHAEDREFCADRPGLGTPACTMAPGSAMLEAGLGEWEHEADDASITDTATASDLLLRIGVTERAEIDLALPVHTVMHVRDRASGALNRAAGVGDLTVAVRHSLGRANGPVALQGFVTLPTGADGVGAGTWSAGALLPVDFKLPGDFELALTPEVDAAPDEDGDGRHLAYGSVVGISHDLGKTLSLVVEVEAFRDLDPVGHRTPVTGALSLAWQARPDLQLDLEADAGLTAAAPRRFFAVGLARRF